MKNERFNHSGITPKVVFGELFVLLEEYGPERYGEEQHNGALLALSHEESKEKKD